jgi:hypothetical protein
MKNLCTVLDQMKSAPQNVRYSDLAKVYQVKQVLAAIARIEEE